MLPPLDAGMALMPELRDADLDNAEWDPVPDAFRRIQRGNAHEFPYGFAYIRSSVFHYRLSVRLGKASQSSNGRGRAVRTIRANVVKDWGGYAGAVYQRI